ncbi:hypothetical protein ACFE04_024473 [Oxalis oulophora]
MHGGLSPDLKHFDQIRNIARPVDVPDQGLVCDLLWADPDKDVDGWGENDRGVSYTFGADKINEFLQKHDLDLICRAHQVVEDGYEFFAKRQLVTIFSAPNYCGEFDNAGAMMSVDDTLTCSFQILKSSDKKGKHGFGNNMLRPGTPPHKERKKAAPSFDNYFLEWHGSLLSPLESPSLIGDPGFVSATPVHDHSQVAWNTFPPRSSDLCVATSSLSIFELN